MKRGQTTIFIILAIVVAIITIVLFSQNQISFINPEIKVQVDNVKNQINNCFDDSILKSLEIIGLHGGYYEKPSTKVYEGNRTLSDLNHEFITYYYYEGQIIPPSTIIVEAELSKALNDNLQVCFSLIETDLSFDYDNLKVKTELKEKEILFDIGLKVTVSSDEHTANFNIKEKINKKSALGDILNLAIFMTESRTDNPEEDCISCLAKIAEDKNLYVDIYNFDESTTLVGIYENYTLDEQQLIFLNKFKEENVI